MHLLLGFPADHINKFILNPSLKVIARLNPYCIKQTEAMTQENLLQIACVMDLKTPSDMVYWYLFVFAFFLACITKACLFKYTENFTMSKHENVQIKTDIFRISAQNIDFGHSLEPPRRGGSNAFTQSMFLAEIRKIMYTPVNISFTI